MFTVIIAILLWVSFAFNVYLLARNPRPDGEIVINNLNGKTLFSLDLGINPDEIHKMSVVVFKVVKEDSDLDEIAE